MMITLLLVVVACGGEDGASNGGESAASGDTVESPCELADAAMVEAAFGEPATEGVEGPARDCEFVFTSGPIDDIRVFEFGAASSWDNVRLGYDNNRGGTVDVAGIGDAAFHPVDSGPLQLVVRSGDQIFAVNAVDSFNPPPPGTEEQVAELARAIADRLN